MVVLNIKVFYFLMFFNKNIWKLLIKLRVYIKIVKKGVCNNIFELRVFKYEYKI